MSIASGSRADVRPQNLTDLNVTVIGAGLMGHSIAGALASAGGRVTIVDSHGPALAAAPGRITEQLINLNRDPSAVEQITLASDLEPAIQEADLVMEAVPERLELKQQLFATVSRLVPDAVLATNTSVFRIGEVFADAVNPERALGTHWWNPPHLIPVVEVVHSDHTDPDIALWAIEILRQAGKSPVHVRKDVPGFIGNRLHHALWREAISLVDAGVCDAKTIDLLVRNSFGLRLAAMGPMENADYIGLDLTLAMHEYLFPSLERSVEPSRNLRDLVAEGNLGAKTGSGFLHWEPGDREAAAARLEHHLISQLTASPRSTAAAHPDPSPA